VAVGADAGFDIYPPLRVNHDGDLSRYEAFFNEVDRMYEEREDRSVRADGQGKLVFRVGERPSLPFPAYAHTFRRFSAKITGEAGSEVMPYLREVCRVAKKHFGERAVWWNELYDDYGPYGETDS
jgi:hypothetical protein